MYERLRDAAWLRNEYERKGRTQNEIADEVGCHAVTVLHAMKRAGIKARRHIPKRSFWDRRYPSLEDGAALAEWYKGMTIVEVAEKIGCSPPTARAALIRHGIPLHPRRRSRKNVFRSDRHPQLYDETWMRREYMEKGRTGADIAEEVGVSKFTVHAAASRLCLVKLPRNPDGPKGYKKATGGKTAHRKIAAEALGRRLAKGETVHHINLDKRDNRIENLLVFASNREHATFHQNPPSWVPRCSECGQPRHEAIAGRPEGVLLLWSETPDNLKE